MKYPLLLSEEGKILSQATSKSLVVTTLAANETIVRSLEVKLKKDSDVDAVVGFQSEPLLPYPVDNAIVDWIKLLQTNESTLATIAAARKDHVQKHLELLKSLEYDLPDTGHSWKREEGKQNPSSTKKIHFYVPDPQINNQPPEYFGATYDTFVGGEHNQATLTALLRKQFPNEEAQVTIIDKLPDSIIYEWSVGKPAQEFAHGWTRIFSTPHGTTTLGYMTQQSSEKIAQLRPSILKTLKKAKVLPSQ